MFRLSLNIRNARTNFHQWLTGLLGEADISSLPFSGFADSNLLNQSQSELAQKTAILGPRHMPSSLQSLQGFRLSNMVELQFFSISIMRLLPKHDNRFSSLIYKSKPITSRMCFSVVLIKNLIEGLISLRTPIVSAFWEHILPIISAKDQQTNISYSPKRSSSQPDKPGSTKI